MSSNGDIGKSNGRSYERFTLPGVDGDTFDELLMRTIGGKILIDGSNVVQYLLLNDFIESKLNDSRKRCAEYLKTRSLEPDPMPDALEFLRFARSNRDSLLLNHLNAHICGHMYHFSKKAELMEVPFEMLKTLLMYGANYILDLSGSSDVLLAIIHNWINFDRIKRRKHRCELMRSITFSKLSSDFRLALMMRLENAADEAMCSKNAQSIPEMKTLEKGIDLGDIIGNVRLNGSISLNLENISTGSFWDKSSPQCMISNLWWRMCAKKIDGDLCIGLQCDGCLYMVPEWDCHASAVFTIKSCIEGKEDFEIETPVSLFSSAYPGFIAFVANLKFEYLIKPENGFVEEDGSITFNALVRADVPFRRMISELSNH